MTLTKQELYNLTLFLNNARSVCQAMSKNTKYPGLRIIYSRILNNLNSVPVNVKPGLFLNSSESGITFGENEKVFKDGTLKSAIRMPHDHLFDFNGKIRLDGGLTLLHEMSHVVLPEHAKTFTARIGLPINHADELFADLLSARVANEMGYKKEVVASHLVRRRSYFKYPIDKLALEGISGVRKEIKKGTFTPMPRNRFPKESPFKPFNKEMPTKGFWPGLKREAPGWMPGLRKRPRMIRPL